MIRMKLHDTYGLAAAIMTIRRFPLSSKNKYAALLLSSMLVIYAVVGGKFGRVSAQDTSIQELDVFNQVYAKIKNDYVDQPSMTTAMVGAIRGLLEQVDPYSGYLNREGCRVL